MAPSALDTTFWVTTTTSPSREVGGGVREQTGEVVAAAHLGHALDGQDLELHAIATSASGGRLGGTPHDRRHHDAAHTRGLDLERQGGVGVVDHEGGSEAARRAGRCPRRTTRARARGAGGRPGP